MRLFQYQIYIVTFVIISCSTKQQHIDQPETPVTKVSRPDSLTDKVNQAFYSLDSIFHQHEQDWIFSENEFPFEIHIGKLFGKSGRFAALRWNENDSTCRVLILKYAKDHWDTVFQVRQQFELVGPIADQFLDFKDFNGDGIPDLCVLKNWWDFHLTVSYQLWLTRNDGFTQVEGFDEIMNPEYDKKTKRIISYQSTGCADMSMYFAEYKLDSLKAKKINELNCDCCIGPKCRLQYNDGEEFKVDISRVYHYVPPFYREAVRSKCRMQ